MADTDDLALYAQWQETKNRDAFDELVSRHAPMVYSVCRRILNAPAEAEEAAIEVFQMLAHAPAGPRTHLPAWLHAAATSRALQRTRPQRQRPQNEPKTAGDSQVSWETLQPEIDSALVAVPWQARIPLIGQYVEDKTQAEIAKEIGLERQRVITDGVTGLVSLRKELSARGIALSESRLKELLAAHMVEPVPSALAPKFSERAVADPLAGRRLAAGFEVDETIKTGSAGTWMIPLAAIVVVAGIVFWVARDRDTGTSPSPAGTGPAEIAETAPPPDLQSPGPRTLRPSATPRTTRGQDGAAPAPASPDAPAEAQTVSFHGIVRDTAGNAVANARIFLGALPAAPIQADPAIETNPMGAFELTGVPADTRQLSVWHEAYKPETLSVAAETLSPLEISLSPAAKVGGIVTYIGSPIAGQSVELVDAAGKTLRTVTGEDGTYMFTDADPGTVQLRAHLAPVEPVLRRRTMYSTAVVAAGLTTDADFTFGALDAAIEGTAMFNDAPARGAKIVARVQTPSGGEEHLDAATQADGTFLIDALPAGPTILQLQSLRVGRTEHFRSVTVQTRSGQTTPCDFVLSGNSTVVVQMAGVPPGATGIVAAIEPGTSLLDLDWPEYSLTPVNLLARIPLTQDGEYTLEGLEAGACTVCVFAQVPPGPATASAQEEPGLPQPIHDAAGLTLHPGGETVLVLQPQ